MDINSSKIAIIGLGYVGLPLSIAFSKKYKTIGFDIDKLRIKELNQGIDRTNQVENLNLAKNLSFSYNIKDIKNCTVYIICVPTPIDENKVPDLSHLLESSKLVGSVLKKGDVVIYESTTYPTCTENECKNALISTSGLVYNKDFFLGYSPERINPSDKIHTLENIKKIISGSTPESSEFIDKLYSSIIPAGTHKAPNIQTAEMAKILENAQRDLNIAFINEAYMICEVLGLDIKAVLDAAKTKWNFLPFSPGLVGGHCISVDPYYLIHKINSIGYHPQVISSGRFVNDKMPYFVAQKIIYLMLQKHIEVLDSHILILGIAFKANCPDVRNSQVPIIKKELEKLNIKVSIYDCLADRQKVEQIYNISLLDSLPERSFDGIFLATKHNEFEKINIKKIAKSKYIFYTL